ncbi:MAG: hypothetical protein HRU08_06575 [Oleispira sp.]|nr:hypothetical protein [Oleispira sp.]
MISTLRAVVGVIALAGLSNLSFSEDKDAFSYGLNEYTQGMVAADREQGSNYQGPEEYRHLYEAGFASAEAEFEKGQKETEWLTRNKKLIDGKKANYHNCILKYMPGTTNTIAANSIKSSCRAKHWPDDWDSKWLY